MTTSQRTYESACPACGAAATFRSAASTHAVCGYCHSTLVRNGEVLENLGKLAQIFDDYSPLQLYAQGQQDGKALTLLGRLQYESPAGRWVEWQVQFDDGRRVLLSEDNGSFVWLAPIAGATALPTVAQLQLGRHYTLLGAPYSLTSLQQTRLIAAQGEFAVAPAASQPFMQAELRGSDGKLLTLTYDVQPPAVYLGKAVDLSALKFTGLKSGSTQAVQGRQFNCPNCASPVAVQFETSKAVTCPACDSLIDVSQGIGGQLRHALQHEPIRPQIALGSIGSLSGKPWQVVGYQHRVGKVLASNDDDESFGWEEYLLYNAQSGFQFLCDTTEGWSLVKPTTGAPKSRDEKWASDVQYLGTIYRLKETYTAHTDYVAGEFYWPLRRDDRSFHQDYYSGQTLLNREQSGQEVSWSIGSRMSHQTVMQAFGIKREQAASFKRDSSPTDFPLASIVKWLMIGLFLLLLIGWMTQCSTRRDCQNQFNPNSSLSAQQQYDQCRRSSGGGGAHGGGSSGGSYGGYSSGGGGHK